MTPNIHYKDREIEDERLELPAGAIYWLGPDLTLCRCTVVLGVGSRWLILMSGRFIDCTIRARNELKNTRWTTMNFKGCRFSAATSPFAPMESLAASPRHAGPCWAAV